MYCIKSQRHDGRGGYDDKILEADYQYQDRDEALVDVMRIASKQAIDGDRVIHSAGMSVILHDADADDGAYTCYWMSGDG